VTLYELDDKFNPTGKIFSDIIKDDYGNFEIKGIELVSPYARLEADGFYRNEVTGNKSSTQIKLYAIADLREKDNININILTHLEYYRVLKLIEDGKSLKEAKKQAQREILAVFEIESDGFANSEDMSIFGTGEGDAALLAISILLQGDLSEADFTERLTDFRLDLSENGKWGNETEKVKMADWARNYGDIENNILSWGLSSLVPDFKKYANIYWTANYFGACTATKQGMIKYMVENTSSYYPPYPIYYYKCDNNTWLPMSLYEYCFSQRGNSRSGTFNDNRDDKLYKWVKIGDQTWMAENLNYAVGGKCYGEDGQVWDNKEEKYVSISNSDIQANCNKYGRIYDWATAMVFDSDCNSADCSRQILPKHRGICPIGWHIPSDDEWNTLNDDVCGTADLFPVLPYDGNFYDVGGVGGWLSASHGWWGFINDGANVSGYSGSKSGYLSVRCVQD
jgi:uncharacterized protein (TIGR02145 family)